MALRPEHLVIDDPEQLDEVLGIMATFTERGRGWINVQPEVPPDAAPAHRSALSQLFRRNSPEAALGTWMPPSTDSPDEPQNLGVQHALGERIAPHLADWNVALGASWQRLQDSPRRGLLVAVPASEPHDVVLRWLLDVVLIATRPETTGRWHVAVYVGRDG